MSDAADVTESGPAHVPVGDWHEQVRCRNCREMIDARATICYLCNADPRYEWNEALAKAQHADEVNSHLRGEGNAARRDHAATRNIPAGGMSGRAGPDGLPGSPRGYRGARGYDDLVKTFKNALKQEGYGER